LYFWIWSEVGIEVGVEKEVAEIVKSVNSTQAEIVFLQPVDQPDGAVFISSEDDNIDLPEEVANALGHDSLTIIADDYIYDASSSEDKPFGFVVVNVE